MKNIGISVVLPAYNEEENIKHTVESCIEYLEGDFPSYEVIVVNDGSSDNTKNVVEKICSERNQVKLVNHEKNMGYGSALLSGFEKAALDYIFLMDSDGQFDISEMDLLLEHIAADTLVTGYRVNRADPYIRLVNQWLYHSYISFMFGLNVRDIDCAFKLFPAKVYKSVKPIGSKGAFFSAEFLIKAFRKGFNIKEVPVSHYPREFGKQTGAELNVIIRMFRESWKFRKEMHR